MNQMKHVDNFTVLCPFCLLGPPGPQTNLTVDEAALRAMKHICGAESGFTRLFKKFVKMSRYTTARKKRLQPAKA